MNGDLRSSNFRCSGIVGFLRGQNLTIRTMPNIVNTNETLIHVGDNTHHHDHVATSVRLSSFKAMNKSCNRLVNPMPLDDVELFAMSLILAQFLLL